MSSAILLSGGTSINSKNIAIRVPPVDGTKILARRSVKRYAERLQALVLSLDVVDYQGDVGNAMITNGAVRLRPSNPE